jgi:hypothetical protein
MDPPLAKKEEDTDFAPGARLVPVGIERFPTGEWTGHYTYAGAVGSNMDLCLDFYAGLIHGTACDAAGASSITGSYDEHGRVSFIKRYAAHRVLYSGVAEGEAIVGSWLIHPRGHGTFRIRPIGGGSAAEAQARAEVLESVPESSCV